MGTAPASSGPGGNARGTLRPGRSLWLVLLLWAAITGLDLNKAFHIDDAFHLLAAQWIGHHPATPMTGLVNWANDPEPLHHFNQPPGFFYLVALTGHLFGYAELPMHAMRALFTLLALLCFHRLARHLAPAQAPWLTALFALCPAFMVNQGLMTDVPLLALQLLFFNLLLAPGNSPPGIRYAGAALALCGALSIKYSALPLLLVLPLALALQRAWRWLPLAVVPVLFLAGWSWWNLQEFGAVHLLERQGGDPSFTGIYVRALGLLTALGAVSPFTPLFLRALVPGQARWLFPAWAAAALLAVALVLAAYGGLLAEPVTDQVLRILFTLNGAVLAACCARFIPTTLARETAATWTLVLWAAGQALFLVLFAPAMATRHVLLLVPPVLLLLAPALLRARLREKALALGSTALLGLLLTLSDKHYAGFYRQQAPLIAAELRAQTAGTTWSLGHWGWQWYAEQAGMPTYGRTTSDVQAGDILVIPHAHAVQLVHEGLVLEPMARWTAPPGPVTFFNVAHFASMYTSGYGELPWNLCRAHPPTIEAFRVKAVR